MVVLDDVTMSFRVFCVSTKSGGLMMYSMSEDEDNLFWLGGLMGSARHPLAESRYVFFFK